MVGEKAGRLIHVLNISLDYRSMFAYLFRLKIIKKFTSFSGHGLSLQRALVGQIIIKPERVNVFSNKLPCFLKNISYYFSKKHKFTSYKV